VLTGMREKNLDVSYGDTVRMTVTVFNPFDAITVPYIMAAYGTYDAATDTFTTAFYGIIYDVSIPSGESSYDIDAYARAVGTFDAMAYLVYDHPVTLERLEEKLVKEDILTVIGYLEITDFVLATV